MTQRHKGYRLDYKPQRKTRLLFEHVQTVLDEYREHLPLTGRQIFYRLVSRFGEHGYAKTDNEADRIGDRLVDARRAGIIEWDDIRDGGNAAEVWNEGGYSDVAEWWDAHRDDLLRSAKRYRRNRMEGQGKRIEVWCEAEGMVPQLARVCRPFRVSVYSGGGQPSVTRLHEAAERIADADVPTVLLQIGDYDEWGERIFETSMEDVEAFVIGKGRTDFLRVRAALTPEQIAKYGLPLKPGKAGERPSVQAEALDPATLATILREAIEDELDLDVRECVLADEKVERDKLVADVEANANGGAR
jgi:hypothetical protein